MSIAESSTGTRARPHKWGWLVLLTSATTLICCVIPILLVSLGFGAAVAALYGNLPLLTVMGQNEAWTFGVTALVLLVAAWALFRPGRACPADPVLAKACQGADKWNRRLFYVSTALWSISFFTVYLLLPILEFAGIF
ncbi:MAG: hypothetical protein Tsb0016_13520 [Sphingomonadales bacterium]